MHTLPESPRYKQPQHQLITAHLKDSFHTRHGGVQYAANPLKQVSLLLACCLFSMSMLYPLSPFLVLWSSSPERSTATSASSESPKYTQKHTRSRMRATYVPYRPNISPPPHYNTCCVYAVVGKGQQQLKKML